MRPLGGRAVNPLLEAALNRARTGACVLPLWWTDSAGICQCPRGGACPSPGKHPLLKRGLHDASTDEDDIRRWWGRWPSGPYTLTAYVYDEADRDGDYPTAPTGLLVCGTLEGDDLAYARITGPSVGGTVELLAAGGSDSPASPADASGSPDALYVVLAGSIAGGALALAAGLWYGRRRWLR